MKSVEQKLCRLGSVYGGWYFIENDNLKDSTIISCGAGEDISFDVEFVSKYGAKIIIVDPTPRAVTHVTSMFESIPNKNTRTYTGDGNQPIESYDLSSLSSSDITLVSKALWNEETTIKFFYPPQKDHVSCSIINYQNGYSTETDHIEVETITLKTLMEDHGIENLPLLKIDIEGAEIEVIEKMVEDKIFPDQLLVEYDELPHRTERGINRVQKTHDLLIASGYELIHSDRGANFLYSYERSLV